MTPLAALLAERIRRFGPITFAEYMRECLYHPVHGYYSQPESRRFADYYTSVDVHPDLWTFAGASVRADVGTTWTPRRISTRRSCRGHGPACQSCVWSFARRSYLNFIRRFTTSPLNARLPVRPTGARLASHSSRGRCQSSSKFPLRIPIGCVFSNELLDALPFTE